MATTDEKILTGTGLEKLWSIIKAKDTALANADANIIATHAKKAHTHPLSDLEQGWVLGCTVSGTIKNADSGSDRSETKTYTIPFIDGGFPDQIKIVGTCTMTAKLANYSSARGCTFDSGVGFTAQMQVAGIDAITGTYTRQYDYASIRDLSVKENMLSSDGVWKKTYDYGNGFAITLADGYTGTSYSWDKTAKVSRFQGGLASYTVNYTISIYVRNLP